MERTNRWSLFGTGVIQVLLVGINTWQIAHEKWVGAFIVGFCISYVWAWNIRRMAFGSHVDRAIYAFGAAVGTVAGLFIAHLIYEY